MFARSVIEEKNELIDQKDSTIRELASKLRGAEGHLNELQAALTEMKHEEELVRSDEHQRVLARVLADVVLEVSAVESLAPGSDRSLGDRIIDMLRRRYGMQLIDDVPEYIDPRLHQVVDVDHSDGRKGAIEILSPGYRMGEVVLRPALVRVTLGVRSAAKASGCTLSTGMQEGDAE